MLKMDVIIKAMVPHQAQILGGLNGSYRLVSNIHTIEDRETASFIRDHELIFMTGVALSGTDMLEELIQSITEKNIAGIIINTGFYISKIPQSIITICNQKSIPLLVLPWKYVLSDLQKTIFRELYSKQYKEEYVSQILEKSSIVSIQPKVSQQTCFILMPPNDTALLYWIFQQIQVIFLN